MKMFTRLFIYFWCTYECYVWAAKVNYDNYQVWKVFPKTNEAIKLFQQSVSELESDKHLNVDIWKLHENEADLMVSGDKLIDVQLALDQLDLNYKVVVESVGKLLKDEEEKLKAGHRSTGFNTKVYHNLDEIYAHLKDLADKYDFVSIDNIGKSSEGRDMLVVKLCVGGCGSKKIMWIDSGMHAREWIGPAANLHMLNSLIDKISKGVDKHLLRLDWYIMPVLNLDGYAYTWTTDRMWRKSRHDVQGTGDCIGVDLNRNFDANWGEDGASKDPCDSDYMGPKPFSEPELINLKNYLIETLGQPTKVVYYMNLHCFSQNILYPFGGKPEVAKDAKDLDTVAKRAYKSLHSIRGSEFGIGQIYSSIHKHVTGLAVDWMYSAVGVKYSYVMELPPTGNSTGFLLPAEDIEIVGRELLAFHESVAKDMVKEFVNI